MKQEIEANYRQIKQDIVQVIQKEMERITNDPALAHLVQKILERKLLFQINNLLSMRIL